MTDHETIRPVSAEPVCRCGHPQSAHDAGECWTAAENHAHPEQRCGCSWYEQADAEVQKLRRPSVATLRPVSGAPTKRYEYVEDGEFGEPVPTNPSAGWDLSFGCNLTFSADDNGDLRVTVSTSDQDQRDGITVRSVTRDQLAAFAWQLMDVVGSSAEQSMRSEQHGGVA